MSENVYIDFNVNEITKEEIEGHQRTLAYWKQRRFPKPKPVPVPEAPPIFKMANWLTDFPRTWMETSSPDSASASVTPTSPTDLTFKIAGTQVRQAGARALYDPTRKRLWTAFADFYDKTVEFVNVWNFPAELPNYHGEGMGFVTAGWQFKNSDAANANAGMAMNLHTVRGQGMRWWLQGNSWETRAQDDSFPFIPVGKDVETRLRVHFHDDPAKGWMQLDYAGKSLKVTGANMSADKKCGAYMCLYGTVSGVMIAKQTRIAVIG